MCEVTIIEHMVITIHVVLLHLKIMEFPSTGCRGTKFPKSYTYPSNPRCVHTYATIYIYQSGMVPKEASQLPKLMRARYKALAYLLKFETIIVYKHLSKLHCHRWMKVENNYLKVQTRHHTITSKPKVKIISG